MELAMRAGLPNQSPTVPLQDLDHLSNLHDLETRNEV